MNQEDFGARIDVTKAAVSAFEKGNSKPSIDSLIKIAQEFQVSLDWIVGLTETDVSLGSLQDFTTGKAMRHEVQLVPVYDVTASAGLVSTYNSSSHILDYLQIPNLPRCDGAIYIKGDSMYPLLKHGDMVAFQRLVDLPGDIDFGSMYIVDMSTATVERIFVKYVQKSEKGEDHVKLVSYNINHAEQDVPLVKIRAMGAVRASIRLS